MEAKNNKLLNIMIELMKSKNKNEIKNKFNINDKEKVKIIKKGLEEAYDEKDEDKLYYVCSAIWEFNLHTEEWIDILCKLSKEDWHNEHEDFASYFQEMRLPRTIDCIYELATSNFQKYRWDDNFALVRKCCFALGDINTPKAKEKLELLLQSDEEMIREHAMEQLKRCDFTNKDVE